MHREHTFIGSFFTPSWTVCAIWIVVHGSISNFTDTCAFFNLLCWRSWGRTVWCRVSQFGASRRQIPLIRGNIEESIAVTIVCGVTHIFQAVRTTAPLLWWNFNKFFTVYVIRGVMHEGIHLPLSKRMKSIYWTVSENEPLDYISVSTW